MTKHSQQSDSESKPPRQKETKKKRMCGTFVLRQGLEKMTEKDRNKFYADLETLGIPPVI